MLSSTNTMYSIHKMVCACRIVAIIVLSGTDAPAGRLTPGSPQGLATHTGLLAHSSHAVQRTDASRYRCSSNEESLRHRSLHTPQWCTQRAHAALVQRRADARSAGRPNEPSPPCCLRHLIPPSRRWCTALPLLHESDNEVGRGLR